MSVELEQEMRVVGELSETREALATKNGKANRSQGTEEQYDFFVLYRRK